MSPGLLVFLRPVNHVLTLFETSRAPRTILDPEAMVWGRPVSYFSFE